ncbi:MAG: lipopolysaccharide heptosyltransferase I [Gammaproteobacteria bacterium]|nr:lipopolysaccharide heptosyltransferase I [Gammaproteobacteria bacterium]
MRVLVVKTSSMGDLIHTFPALTDACRALPDVRFDWVVEEGFAEIPTWHPAVDRVIPVALRRWRQKPFATLRGSEWRGFREQLNARHYDCIIDAQGLLKSALVTRLARGTRCGFSRRSAREPLAALAYQQTVTVDRNQHAVERVRQLFARVLGYSLGAVEQRAPLEYGIDVGRFGAANSGCKNLTQEPGTPYLVYLHGTTWPSKLWPERYWVELARQAGAAGFRVCLPWGSDEEHGRAKRIAAESGAAHVCEKLSLAAVAVLLSNAGGVVAVDTGLAHLAAALAKPAVTIYGSTQPALTGTLGNNQRHAAADFGCAPCLKRDCRYGGDSDVIPACYGSVVPSQVWQQLSSVMAAA